MAPGGSFLGAVLALAVLKSGAPADAAQTPSECTPEGGTIAAVAKVADRGDLVLADGREVKLAGIDLPAALPDHPFLAQAARAALAQWLGGREITLRPALPGPDRWGRVVAHAFAPADFTSPELGEPFSVAGVLVDAGLARARPAPEARDCIGMLIAAEAEARRNRLGLWADPYYAVIDATDSARLADRAGTFVLIEGQVTRVGYGRTRTFVNFGRSRESLAVTITKRKSRIFEAAGLAPASLVGVRLRVRGILDTRYGPQIEVSDPHEIERL